MWGMFHLIQTTTMIFCLFTTVINFSWFQFSRYPNSVASLSFNHLGEILAIATSYTYQEANEMYDHFSAIICFMFTFDIFLCQINLQRLNILFYVIFTPIFLWFLSNWIQGFEDPHSSQKSKGKPSDHNSLLCIITNFESLTFKLLILNDMFI